MMTSYTRTPKNRADRSPCRALPTRPRKGIALLALAAAFLAVSSVVTFALWKTQATQGALTQSGTMDFRLGESTWSCPEQEISGTFPSLDQLVLQPKQTLIIRQEILGTFQGDNLAIRFGVRFPSLPEGTTGSWHLERNSVQIISPRGIEESAITRDVVGVENGTWILQATLSIPADVIWVDPSQPVAESSHIPLGIFTITAEQERCGFGFLDPCEESS